MSRNKIPVLMYHRITDGSTQSAYDISLEDFRSQMAYLKEKGFNTIDTGDIEQLSTDTEKETVMITFDDGHKSDHIFALPVLKEFDMKATFFITSSYIGTGGYMTEDNIRELKDSGFSVQSHGKTHKFLGLLEEDELKDELCSSKETIKNITEHDVSAISFPGGSFNRRVIDEAKNALYKYMFSSIPGYNSMPEDARLLKRMLISGKTSLESFKCIVMLNRKYYMYRAFSYIIKVCAKKLMGRTVYHKIWKKLDS
ncbi:polysaccharide deacetylase family protein [Elusimicrobiota bacterium]